MREAGIAIRNVVRGVGDRNRARQWQERVRTAEDAPLREDLALFTATLRCTPGPGRVALARARDPDGRPFWAGLPTPELLAIHGVVSGSTGSGKTYFALAMLQQLLCDGHPAVVMDFKGELTQLILDTIVPALCQTDIGPELLRNLRVIRPFDEEFLPLLRITQPEPGVPREIQAHNLTASVEEALSADLGMRMNRLSLRLASLCIELNEPLTALLTWLEQPATLAQAARRSQDPALRQYAFNLFSRENRTSIDALAARLDAFLFLPSARLALSAPGCVSFVEALDAGLTVVDVGNPPAGAERAARFWGSVLLGRLVRAILSRPVTPRTPQTPVYFEEFQEGLGRHQVPQFGRLLALARFKRVSLWFLHQQMAQVSSVDPALMRLMRTNTGIEAIFRCNLEDARVFAQSLPVARDAGRASEARATLAREMTQLPRRSFYLWLRQAPFHAHVVRSPRLDLGRDHVEALPEDLRAFIRCGTVAMPIAELERYVSAEAEAAATHRGRGMFAPPQNGAERLPGLG